jgi:hypothetical protein
MPGKNYQVLGGIIPELGGKDRVNPAIGADGFGQKTPP